jgi:hypothetical protein
VLTRVYLAGIAFIGLATFAISRATPRIEPLEPHVASPALTPEAPGDARGWFASVKPFCNVVEVETALRQSRPPAGDWQGPAYEAACLALAGKVDRARGVIGGLPADQRARAAGIVFEVAHPVADAGDDKSAGPIMAMVVEFWPNHYMALYHAGASEFALGDRTLARKHLEAFLVHYAAEDGWRSNAKRLLAEMDR